MRVYVHLRATARSEYIVLYILNNHSTNHHTWRIYGLLIDIRFQAIGGVVSVNKYEGA